MVQKEVNLIIFASKTLVICLHQTFADYDNTLANFSCIKR